MNIKKLILAVALCLVLAVALFIFDTRYLAAIDREDILGSWITEVPAGDRVEQSLAQFGIAYDIADDLTMTYEFQYREDGIVTVRVEETSAREIAAVQTEALRAGLPDMLYAQYAQSGMDRAATDELLTSQGMTMESLVEMALEQFDFEAQYTSEALTLTQYYCVEKNRICYAASPVDLAAGNYDMTVEVRLSGNTLILSNALDKEGAPFEGNGVVKYPLTLTRK